MRRMADPRSPDAVTDVTLVIPATNDHIRFARLMASAVGTRLGFDYDELEDLRIAISELCTSVTEGASNGSPLTLTYRGDAIGVHITGHHVLEPSSSAPPELGELSLQVLAAVAAEHTFETSAAEVRFALVVRAATPPAP